MQLEFFIDEMQWEDNYSNMWKQPEQYMGKKMCVFLMIENFDGRKIKKLKKNEKKIHKIGEGKYNFKGKIIDLQMYENNPNALTVVIDCGIPINVRPKNFNLKLGDSVEFEAKLFGEWTNIFHGCKKIEIKILEIKKRPQKINTIVEYQDGKKQIEERIRKNSIVITEVNLEAKNVPDPSNVKKGLKTWTN